MPVSVLGQSSIGCFVEGGCMGSLYLASAYIPQGDPQCLEYCATVEGSKYFTYDSGDSYCFCWANCEELSASECANCVSGDIACFQDECFVPNARVNGIFISGDPATAAHECAEQCTVLEACKWFTYDSEAHSCVLTEDREFMSDCVSCTYGHDDCMQKGTSGFTSLFTCGGLCDNNCGAEIEVTDLPFLDGSQPSRTCSEMPQMPSVKSSHIAMWDDGGKSVLYCGGYNSESKRCLKYYNNEWINLGDILLHERGESSAVELSDGRYWISGGMVGSDGGETSEYYQDGVLSEGPQLPHTLNRHCAVEVEPGFVFISGNSVPGFEKTTLRFDPSNGTFKSLPDMTYGRYRPGCGVVRKGSSYEIVVAGGHLSENDQYWSSSEIYNTETQEWREGPTLPHTIYASSSVQYDNTFLLVGGRNYSYQYLDTIYQYNQTSETWILRPERLSTPKGFMAAVLAGPPVAACG